MKAKRVNQRILKKVKAEKNSHLRMDPNMKGNGKEMSDMDMEK